MGVSGVLQKVEKNQKEPFKNHFRHKYDKIAVDGGMFPSLMELVNEENDFNYKRSLLVEQEMRKKKMPRRKVPLIPT